MCITFLYINPTPSEGPWQVILINTRDEFFDRPTQSARWSDGILCSRDLYPGKEGGTWLGMNESGKIAVLMNFLEDHSSSVPSKNGRGFFVINYLSGADDEKFFKDVLGTKDSFQGFSLLLIRKYKSSGKWNIKYLCNRTDNGVEDLKAGFYGFGNSYKNRPFKKVQAATEAFRAVVGNSAQLNADKLTCELLTVLKNPKMYFPDEQLESQAFYFNDRIRRGLCKCFVDLRPDLNFGSRTHTVILIDRNDDVTYTEQNNLIINGVHEWNTQSFNFTLTS